MKVCPSCRASFDESLAICPYCGTIVQDKQPAVFQQPAAPVVFRQETKESVSVGGWIGRSLIPYIPLVGGIVYLIMLFIWSGDKKKEDSFRNWAKAQLIIMAVVVVLAVVFALVFGSAFSDLLNSY